MNCYLGSGNRSLKRSRDHAFSSSKAVFSDTSHFKSSVGRRPTSFRKALLATLPKEPRQEIEPRKKSKKEDSSTTLLHSAVLFGACPRTISGLIKRHPEAASVIDKSGRTPLHLACICWNHHFSGMGDTTSFSCKQERVMKVIRDLCDAASYSINIEDNDDMSALEYAIISDMPLAAVKRIQKASVEEWQMREHHPEIFTTD
jgi:ankyrin repeat protein